MRTAIVLISVATFLWWIAAIFTGSADVYARAAFSVCVVAITIHPDTNPIFTAAAGALAYRDLRRALMHYRYGRYSLD